MEIIITRETPCEVCGDGIINGKMAQVPEGYVCEFCVQQMAESDLVTVRVDVDFGKD